MSSCPKGQIERVAYSASRKGTSYQVPTTCVKDRGLPGKTPESQKIHADMKKDELGKHGYHQIRNMKADDRHAALAKAVAEYGALSVMRKLNLLMVLQRNSSSTLGTLFERDRNWVRKTYMNT